MTTVDRSDVTAGAVLASARALAPTIAARAAEVEAARRVPRDLRDELVAAGCYRVSRPASHGGVGAPLVEVLRVFESLAAADGSVAWTVMIGGASWIDLAELPRATFDEIFAAGPDVVVAGAIAPSGTIRRADGGYRVTGRWGFVSGCQDADWIFGNCMEGVVDGVPSLRIAVFRPEQVGIEDTWHVAGLRGTGSHHVHVRDVAVPAEWTERPFVDESSLDTPVVRIPPAAVYGSAIASVAVGIAQGALDDITALAEAKVPLLSPSSLATNPTFQLDLATADTQLRAARALLHETAESLWAIASAGEPFDLPVRARARAAAVWATATAAGVVDTAYRSGGGTALYEACPLQRRLRDVHAVTQHFAVKRDTMATAGAVLAGQEIHVPVF